MAASQKLACHVQRGDLIRHERRVYRVRNVELVVLYPRDARITGATSRCAYRLVMSPARASGGRSISVRFEATDLIAVSA
jgi:hypothetical protein